jgi:enamine deaminase RidA (YjgF/YER057c/UK114 family)
MARVNVSGNSPWEPLVGYSRAVRVGPHVWVAGTTATDDSGSLVGAGDAGAQARRALENIRCALEAAGASMAQVVRTRMYVTHVEDAQAIGAVHAEFFGAVRPVATLVEVSRLVAPEMRVEIEAEAYIEG